MCSLAHLIWSTQTELYWSKGRTTLQSKMHSKKKKYAVYPVIHIRYLAYIVSVLVTVVQRCVAWHHKHLRIWCWKQLSKSFIVMAYFQCEERLISLLQEVDANCSASYLFYTPVLCSFYFLVIGSWCSSEPSHPPVPSDHLTAHTVNSWVWSAL